MKLSVQNDKIFAATGGRALAPELPLVIFLHGSGMDHTVWNLQTRYFAYHGYSVLAIDFPGHGRSGGLPMDSIEQMAEWIPELISAAIGTSCSRQESAFLVGHSMGALVALECAASYPEKVRALCLMGASAKMPVHPDLLEAALKDDPIAYDLVTSWGHGPAGHLGRTSVPGLSLIGGGRALLSSAPKGVLGVGLTACNAYQNGLSAAGKVRCSALCIIGKDDKMTPANKGIELASTITKAKFHLIQDCGHMMMLENSYESLKTLKEYFQQL